jgi:NAD(P)H-dependent flavin oxidoreductase YrpB (nitropropane dioxygenase family)
MTLPIVIQGGMGAAVSSWRLARAVSMRGQMGVVSGTGIDTVLARRLQLGDPGGHLRAAFDAFPVQAIAQQVWARYFRAEGKGLDAAFKSKPVPMIRYAKSLTDLTVVGSFVEVYLAKCGHGGLVGINLLEKIQLPTLPALFGAMLAKVDYVLMGAGIPRQIPKALTAMSQLETARLTLDVAGALPDEEFHAEFDPRDYCPGQTEGPPRPKFLAIVASNVLARMLVRKCTPPVDGLVIEGPTAGGHNAPPRGALQLNENSEPVYGSGDVVDLEEIRKLDVPFWLAGSYGNHEKLQEALSLGAAGVQVGTPFAFCEESGITQEIKKTVLAQSRAAKVSVYTDRLASPTGFPFKVLQLAETSSDQGVYLGRTRICDLGYLRQLYKKSDGTIGYRCPAEPEDDYVEKGGTLEDTVGRKCICNGLLSTIGLGQVRDGDTEAAIVTSGDDVANIYRFVKPGRDSYTADDVLDVLLNEVRELASESKAELIPAER